MMTCQLGQQTNSRARKGTQDSRLCNQQEAKYLSFLFFALFFEKYNARFLYQIIFQTGNNDIYTILIVLTRQQ